MRRTIRVLESVGPPHRRRNPYLQQLFDSLPEQVTPVYFSWGTALFGRFDVFHVHWPEVLLRGRTPSRSVLRWVVFALVLIRIRVQRRAIVRTLHNLSPHDPPNYPQRLLLRLVDRWTTLWITMSATVSAPPGASFVVIPHGHYRDWFAELVAVEPNTDPVPGRLLNLGLVRRYKGIEELLRAFSEIDDKGVSLRIVGSVEDADLVDKINSACNSDSRVTAVDAYVSDRDVVREMVQGEVVVLPFTSHTNSGSLILALSLGRPVLVPSGPVVDEIAEEVGPGWVFTFSGPLAPDDITTTLSSLRSAHRFSDSGSGPSFPALRRSDGPNLSARDWAQIGAMHADAFDHALALVAQRRRFKR